MSQKKRVVRRKGVGLTHIYHGPNGRRRTNAFVRFLQRVPGKAWWFGGLLVAAGYIWFFYYFFVSPYGFRWRALYGDVSYPEGYEIHGIDISHHQGSIQWDTLAAHADIGGNPVRFVVMKATEGATVVDEYFPHNFRMAKKHGFIRGAYHYWSVKSSATAQARYFIRHAKLQTGDLPPVLDVEQKNPNLTDAQFRDSVQKWLDIVDRDIDVAEWLQNKTVQAMDTPRILSRDEAIQFVRRYKQVIAPRFNGQVKVMMYGSYAKGCPTPWSDIDVAVIIPKVNDEEWLKQSTALVRDGRQVTSLIEPVLMEEHEDSILYDDVMHTGVTV